METFNENFHDHIESARQTIANFVAAQNNEPLPYPEKEDK
jgi:hypothetical protein